MIKEFASSSRSRAAKTGWLGRRRTYTCRRCGVKFQRDLINPLPLKLRVCQECLESDRIAIRVANHQGKWSE